MSEVIKDIARQERLNQVYRHLFAHFGISSQTEYHHASASPYPTKYRLICPACQSNLIYGTSV